MFCPKCGTKNPDTGKFCRSCGTDLGNVSAALTSNEVRPLPVVDRKGKPISLEGAITKGFMGLAFMIVSVALAFSGTGRGWWFWLLIPAFSMLGAGLAQYMQLKRAEGSRPAFAAPSSENVLEQPRERSELPPLQTEYVSPESRYKTGDLVPPSVTEGTTRHLDLNSEGETMTLPKKPQ